MDKLRKLTKLRKLDGLGYGRELPYPRTFLFTHIDKIVTVLKTLEWSNPTPDADNDGACPICFAGKPMKFQVIPEAFDPKNHMVYCKLAEALTLLPLEPN
jgi:hypothetical protein